MSTLRGTRGTGYPVGILPLFGLGYRTPLFRMKKVKNLLSSVVNRGDLRLLNYNKTVFGPAGRTIIDVLPDPRIK